MTKAKIPNVVIRIMFKTETKEVEFTEQCYHRQDLTLPVEFHDKLDCYIFLINDISLCT